MTDEFMRMIELSQEGFYCSQILLILGLEAQGKSNPDLVRSMGGLVGGMGFCGKTCGALTGGACLLGLYAGKGEPDELEDSRLNSMVAELVDWFEQEYQSLYGGVACNDILEQDPGNRSARCPQLVLKTYEKVNEILTANGYDLAGGMS